MTTITSDTNTTTPYTNTTATFYPTTGANITTYSTPTTIGTNATSPYTNSTLPPNPTTIPSANTTHYNSTTIPITTANTTTTTISPTTLTPPTTTALICDNGGKPENGVCICPDEWTGVTCSEGKKVHRLESDGSGFFSLMLGEDARSRQTDSNVSLGFVLYQNDCFFRSKLYMRRRATVRVLSASVRGQEPNVVPQHVEMMFRPRVINGTSLYDFSCVFWNYSQKDWSTSGCSKGNTSDGLMRCFCNHTTNFAALWSFSENYEYAEALGAISIVGLSLSFLGLIVTIIYNVKEMRTNCSWKNLISRLCIYFSLLAFIITFVSGVQNSSRQIDIEVQTDDRTNNLLDSDEHVEPDRGSCTAVAALLHFLLMATFMWNSVNGTQILIQKMRRSLPPHWTLLSMALGWGVPALFMTITLGVTYRVDNPLRYRQEEFCWLAALDKNKHFSFEKPLFWGFLLPVGLILIYNIVLLVYVSIKATRKCCFRKSFLECFTLAVLLGVSWVFGYLVLVTSGTMNLVFSILFCLCTTTQGLQIFIITATTPTFRAAMSRSVQYLSSVSISFNNVKYRLWKNWHNNHSEKYRER
uniref:Adhesion G protein-coupled receptor G7 n=1 Tax=Oreochromis niloticus TaxID=8128 RepID=A0A669DL70_ORENI